MQRVDLLYQCRKCKEVEVYQTYETLPHVALINAVANVNERIEPPLFRVHECKDSDWDVMDLIGARYVQDAD